MMKDNKNYAYAYPTCISCEKNELAKPCFPQRCPQWCRHMNRRGRGTATAHIPHLLCSERRPIYIAYSYLDFGNPPRKLNIPVNKTPTCFFL